MKNKRRDLSGLIIMEVLTITAGILNVSYGQTKVDKLDKLISAYAVYFHVDHAIG